MTYRIAFTHIARKQFLQVGATLQMRISNKIATLEINPRGADSLKLSVEDNYRVRVGDYRIVYDIQDEVRIVSIIRIQHRKDAYR